MKIILSLLLFVPLLGFSQAWQFQAPAGRPLRQVIRELRDQFGWLITFEDGPYQGNNARLASNENLLIPSTGPVLFKLDRFDAQHARQFSVDEQDKVVHKLVWQHNRGLKMGAFRDIHEGPYIHVVPFLWSNDGRARGYTSLLDSSVTLRPISDYPTLAAVVEDIIGQVSASRKVTISLGSIPNNVFLVQHPLFDIPPGIKASDALVNLFGQANRMFPQPGTTGYCWELVYDPNSRTYFFNVASVNNPAALAIPASTASPGTNSVQTTVSGGSKVLKRTPSR